MEKIIKKFTSLKKSIAEFPGKFAVGLIAWFVALWLWIIGLPKSFKKMGIRWYQGVVTFPQRTKDKIKEMKTWSISEWKKRIVTAILNRAILIALIIIIIVIAVLNKHFISLLNVSSILKASSYRIILALGAGTIIVGKGTDLSVGRIVGFSALIGGIFSQDAMKNPYIASVIGHSPFVVMLVTMCVGMFFGMINGFVVTKLKVDPFIATLGMMLIAFGGSYFLTDKISHGGSISGFSDVYFDVINKPIIKIGNFWVAEGTIIAFVIAFAMWILWAKTPLGKKIFAVGGNAQAAAVSGIKVGKVLFFTYVLGGALYGIGASLLTWKSGTVKADTATMFELDAIAACIVGGLSFDGGRGKISGILIGVIIFECINNGFTMIGMSSWMVYLIKGLIIIAAIAFDMLKVRKKK